MRPSWINRVGERPRKKKLIEDLQTEKTTPKRGKRLSGGLLLLLETIRRSFRTLASPNEGGPGDKGRASSKSLPKERTRKAEKIESYNIAASPAYAKLVKKKRLDEKRKMEI